jgi:hypothetical protein
MRSTFSLLLVAAAAAVSHYPVQARVSNDIHAVPQNSLQGFRFLEPKGSKRKSFASKFRSLLIGRQDTDDEDVTDGALCVDNRYAKALRNISEPEVDVFCNVWLGRAGLTSTVTYTPYA